MIGLDANVLVRYFARDDAVQARRAAAVIEQLSEAAPGFVSAVALAETVWTLDSSYDFSSTEIAAAVRALLEAYPAIVVEHADEALRAMLTLERGEGEFTDALIALVGIGTGCDYTVTFDKRAQRLAGFAPVP